MAVKWTGLDWAWFFAAAHDLSGAYMAANRAWCWAFALSWSLQPPHELRATPHQCCVTLPVLCQRWRCAGLRGQLTVLHGTVCCMLQCMLASVLKGSRHTCTHQALEARRQLRGCLPGACACEWVGLSVGVTPGGGGLEGSTCRPVSLLGSDWGSAAAERVPHAASDNRMDGGAVLCTHMGAVCGCVLGTSARAPCAVCVYVFSSWKMHVRSHPP